MKRTQLMIFMFVLCVGMQAQTSNGDTPARVTEPVVLTEYFSQEQPGTGFSSTETEYKGENISWTMLSARVDAKDAKFGEGNNCARLQYNSETMPSKCASIAMEPIEGIKEIQFKMKRGDENVRLRIYRNTSVGWKALVDSVATVKAYSYSEETWKPISWDEVGGYTSTSEDVDWFSIEFKEPKDRQVKWGIVAGKALYIDDVKIVHYPYAEEQDEQWDMTKKTEAGEMGIVCWNKAVDAGEYEGAEFYEVAYREGLADKPTNLVVEEVKQLEAGMPYIYVATASMINCNWTGEAVSEAKDKNGLHGTLAAIDNSTQLENNWVLYDNTLMQVGSGCHLGANKGYIVMSEVQESAGMSLMPGKKMLSISPKGAATPLVSVQQGELSIPTKRLVGQRLIIHTHGYDVDILGRRVQ